MKGTTIVRPAPQPLPLALIPAVVTCPLATQVSPLAHAAGGGRKHTAAVLVAVLGRGQIRSDDRMLLQDPIARACLSNACFLAEDGLKLALVHRQARWIEVLNEGNNGCERHHAIAVVGLLVGWSDCRRCNR